MISQKHCHLIKVRIIIKYYSGTSRSCTSPRPYCGGSSCAGGATKTERCDDQCCKRTHGGWTDWVGWGKCSCDFNTGTGTRSTTRSCTSPNPSCGGSFCPGDAKKSERCDDQCCKRTDGGWSAWVSNKCSCNFNTGTGTVEGTRVCNSPAPSCGGKGCVGDATKTEECDDQCCKRTDGGWSAWVSGKCSCNFNTGTGTIEGTRVCDSPAPNCGGKNCVGDATKTERCDDQCCKRTDGGWSAWVSGKCSCNFNTGTGTIGGTRACNSPAPSCGGKGCLGDATKTERCDDQCCKRTDGGWSAWVSGKCSCNFNTGTGTIGGTRVCNSPAPSCGGKSCVGDAKKTERCDDQCCKKTDGGWSAWVSGKCSCNFNTGTGTIEGTRVCNSPAPSCGGKSCLGDAKKTERCDDQCCKRTDGGWSAWVSGKCSCNFNTGTGTIEGTRVCNSPAPSCGGKSCLGDAKKTERCDDQCCKRTDGGWSAWVSGKCSCNFNTGTGTIEGTRVCNSPAPSCGGKNCVGDAKKTERCDDQCCKRTDGGWSAWVSGKCSCNFNTGTGTIGGTRVCNSPAPSCGGKSCLGDAKKTERCDDQCCKRTDGGWSAWVSGKCSCNFNTGTGTIEGTRVCNSPAPSCGGKNCVGDAKKTEECDDQCCKRTDGGWSAWVSDKCSCNFNTGTGTIGGTRVCNSPAPSCGGKNCVGDAKKTEECDDQCCKKTDGGWSAWVSGKCSCDFNTGTGTIGGTRVCNSPAPSCGGKNCVGDATKTERCDDQCCKKTDGGWSAWVSDKCSCNFNTGTGTIEGTRVCNSPAPSCGGKNCVGDATKTERCDDQCCKKTDGGWSAWVSDKCSCNFNTGTGTIEGTRVCNSPAPSCGGKSCVGDAKKTERCDDQCCKKTAGGWTDWVGWGKCSCDFNTGTGTRSTTRSCTSPNPSCGGSFCPGDTKKSERCDDQCCKRTDGGWNAWVLGKCSCNFNTGTGTIEGTRVCNSPAPSCGGKNCVGDATKTERCDDQCCKRTDGGWSAWVSGKCSCNFNTGTGTIGGTRACNSPAPSCGGKNCVGDAKKTERCDDQCCKRTDGGWSAWVSNKCSCNFNTGTGTIGGTRVCNSPAPNCGGKNCVGDAKKTERCDDQCCKRTDGGWSAWVSDKCSCDFNTGTGTIEGTRSCNSPAPSCGGKSCLGDAKKTEEYVMINAVRGLMEAGVLGLVASVAATLTQVQGQ